MNPEIIKETKDYLIINKPAGLIVHGGAGIVGPTLADWIAKKYPKLKTVGENPERPGIVHRLDKDVSGLMIICKTQKFFTFIKEKFQTRDLIKEYTGLIYGQLPEDDMDIDFPIKRSSRGFKMAAVPQNYAGEDKTRRAITHLITLKKFINYSLLKIKIDTGRTHQIRVHLFALGHPLVGDPLYASGKNKRKNQKINLGRVFLAATGLEFADLNGEIQKFSAPLAPELEKFLGIC